MAHAVIGIIVILFFLLLPKSAGSEELNSDLQPQDVIATTEEEIRSGIAVMLNGRLHFLQVDDITGDFFTVKTDEGDEIHISLIKEQERNTEVLFIPVQIEDKVLARGVTLRLISPEGTPASVKIPPKRVFFSIPFNIPLRSDVHPAFEKKNVIVQVIPKITKKAQVEVSNTAVEGVVADIKYEGLAYLKLKDLLNRMNRQDMDGTFFIGKEKEDRWSVFVENLFEKFDERDLAIMRDHPLTPSYHSRIRLDNLQNYHNIAFGTNIRYREGKTTISAGNIDRRVKERTHTELSYGDDEFRSLVRFEGVEIKNPPDRRPLTFKADRFGYQFSFNSEKKHTALSGIFGNLKVEDYKDQGEIDDHFNFIFTYSHELGETLRPYTRKKFLYTGEFDIELYGSGSASWVRGEVNFNISYRRFYLIYLRFNNDFARLTGEPRKPLWENRFFSIMRVRDYFNQHDPLNRWNIESIYVDFALERQGKGSPFSEEKRFGFSRYLKVWKYDVPMDVYLETDKAGKFRPGLGISIRQYL
ncbi:MAG: hypothetical protein AB1546_06535 [bacterium]